MKSFDNRSGKRRIVAYALQVISFLGFTAALWICATQINRAYRKNNIELLKQSVKRTAVECYSVEGAYPPTVDYLVSNYDLIYDTDRYYIFYDTFAENVMPVIEVYEKK